MGIGFDSYAQWQALPVFGNVHFDVLGTKNVTFIQVNYGWAHAWKQKTEGTPPTSARGGQIFNPMVGCRLAAGNLELYLAAGYKFQSTTTQYDYLFDSSFQNYYGSTRRIEQNLRHIVFTLGVGWR